MELNVNAGQKVYAIFYPNLDVFCPALNVLVLKIKSVTVEIFKNNNEAVIIIIRYPKMFNYYKE